LDKVIDETPSGVWIAYGNRAIAYSKEGRLKEAIELNAKKPKAYLNRGAAFFLSGRYREAIEDYTKAIEMVPNGPAPICCAIHN
jgi:tetratricopeptide (TPR) repeat protein